MKAFEQTTDVLNKRMIAAIMNSSHPQKQRMLKVYNRADYHLRTSMHPTNPISVFYWIRGSHSLQKYVLAK
jgi:hypothetical protein